MAGYVKVFASLLRSSLWVTESKPTRLVWITLLALADRRGVVESSVVGLADAAKVTADECKEALERFLSPDPDDTSKVDDGRRLKEVSGGWEITNFKTYRMKLSEEDRREYKRKKQEEYRAKIKQKPSPEENAFVKSIENGEPVEKQDSIVERTLPEKDSDVPF